MVLCADGNGIQSDSHPENCRGIGMSLVLLSPSQTSGNSVAKLRFSAAC
jgi:hypothetical protein